MLGLATKMAADARPREKSPEFLVAWNSDSGWWTSLKAVCSRSKLPLLRTSTYFHSPDVSSAPVAGGSFTASFLMHCALILLIFYLPQALPANVQAFDSAPTRVEKIYYRVPLLDSTQTLPRIAPAGPGARPGTGLKPDQLPALGSTAAHNNLTIVSKPSAPDNNR